MPKSADVMEAITKFDWPSNNPPGMIDPELLVERIGLIKEEVIELQGAADQLIIEPSVAELENAFDAMIDIIYAVMVLAAMFGFDIDEGWRRVHAANIRKYRATNNDNKRRSKWDILKPEGWQPPVLTDLVTSEEDQCAIAGSSSVSNYPSLTGLISTAEIERSFGELLGPLKEWHRTLVSQTSATPPTSSDS